MILRIISPTITETHSINWLETHTPCGSIIIQPGHAPIILTLLANTFLSFSLKTGEKKEIALTRPCFLEVKRDSATVIINQE
jgi:F0F1-type ATP synthase epsilon subunit